LEFDMTADNRDGEPRVRAVRPGVALPWLPAGAAVGDAGLLQGIASAAALSRPFEGGRASPAVDANGGGVASTSAAEPVASASRSRTPRAAAAARVFRTAFTAAPIGTAVVDGDGRMVVANEALAQITGVSCAELAGRPVGCVLGEQYRAEEADNRRRICAGDVAVYEGRMELRHADGTTKWIALTMAQDGASPVSLVYQLRDISERRALEGRLEYLIDHDFLTGLFNRRRFEQELESEVARQRRYGLGAALVMVDLDGFKAVNDQFGHAAGDQLLRGLAAALRARSRVTDVLARLSGDEFVLLTSGVTRDQAETVAGEVVAVVRRHEAALGDERLRTTGSAGVALLDQLDAGQVLALADAAMYAAKEAGGDRFVMFTAGQRDAVSRRVGEASRLRGALRDGRFVLHCQPIRDLAEDRVEHFELLIRMQGDAPGELIAPNAFLYAAERFGLITAIDRWVVSQAIALVKAEQDRGRRVVLAVNLSGHSIGDPDLAAQIDREIDEGGIDASSLVFEITETAAIRDLEAAQRFTLRLHHRGCRFALDDFGAGFASFYYLKSLPFDYIKIDGDFIRGLSQQPVDQLVVGAIVTIAKGMGKRTIAEFVGDAETRDLLRAEGVDCVQGFYVGRPRPVAHVLAELA
jgi:diguanylate cyclase (GGDEF)-like protein/PAS domain S-box-containing protein